MEKAKAGTRFRLFLAVGAYLAAAVMVLSGFLSNIRPVKLGNVQLGVPKIVTEDPGEVRSEILQVLSSQDQLYVLHRNGIVKVYSPDGSFQYAIGFYAHPNGRFGMALENGELIVRDRVGNCYYFCGTAFEQFLERGDTGNIGRNWDRSSEEHEIRGNSVWYVPENGAKQCIIRDSGLAGHTKVMIAFLAIGVAGWALHWPKSRKTEL